MEDFEQKEKELLQKSKELEEKIKKISELEQLTSKEIEKIEALRQEQRRIAEKLEAKKREYFQEQLAETYKKLNVSEEFQKQINEMFANKEVPEDKLEEEVKKAVVQLDWQSYWQMKEEREKLKGSIAGSAGSVSNNPPIQQTYSEEVLKYAQEHNLEPEKAKKILEKFSSTKRVLESL
jgi:hypothetical protein